MPRNRDSRILGRVVYESRKEPVRYMASGMLRPCYVCKKAERAGSSLFAKTRTTPMAKYVWSDGARRIHMEQRGGEIVPVRYMDVQATNYHPECEAERAKEKRLGRPKRLKELELLKQQNELLVQRVDDLAAQVKQLSGGKVMPSGPRTSPGASEQLRQASQMSPGFVGSGRGRRTRTLVEAMNDAARTNAPRVDETRAIFARLDALYAADEAQGRSQSDPDSAGVPSGKKPRVPPPLGYDPNEILTEEGYDPNARA